MLLTNAQLLEWLNAYPHTETSPDFADGTVPAAGFDEGYDAGWIAAIESLTTYVRVLAKNP